MSTPVVREDYVKIGMGYASDEVVDTIGKLNELSQAKLYNINSLRSRRHANAIHNSQASTESNNSSATQNTESLPVSS